MSESSSSKNYLLGTKISFLTISFVILVLAYTVKNDIWPFLQTTSSLKIPIQSGSFLFASFWLCCSVWLLRDWPFKAVRYSLLSIIIMMILQLVTEIVVKNYFFSSLAVPTSILYIGYRIIQLINLQRVLNKVGFSSDRWKSTRTLLIGMSILFWSFLWVKITFYIFPQIICQIF
jgi:hypothetical protein